MGLGLKVHVGHVLVLEHDLGLGVAQVISLVGITSHWDNFQCFNNIILSNFLGLSITFMGLRVPKPCTSRIKQWTNGVEHQLMRENLG